MSTTLLIIGGLLVAFIAYAYYSFKKMKKMPATADHKNIKTLNDKNFNNQIKNGILLVDFWAPWCGPCKMMAPILNEIAELDSDKATIGKVNVDNQQALAQKYQIRSIPTLVMFADGKEVKRFTGVKNRNFLLKEIEEYK
jgi:thioredoxin 1